MTNNYDIIPYQSKPYYHTHPNNLCSVGRLFGMTPADPTECRVLELGCASGGNLAPMAEQLPNSRFVGIDASTRQIEEGNTTFAPLELDNLSLFAKNIMELDRTLGEFDYIICHGVYSWVPKPVQEKILSICNELLSPQGIAYISFNTYPGWHMRQNIRQMMLYHAARFKAPEKRIEQSRALIEFLVEQLKDLQDPYAIMLKNEIDRLDKTGDYYLFHEHLESHNTPCYFHEFAAELKRFNLQYLGDAEAEMMLGRGLQKETRNALSKISTDIIQMEQYMDFVRNRMFRMTLICKEPVELKRNLNFDSIHNVRLAMRLKGNQSIQDTTSEKKETFHIHSGQTIGTANPAIKTAISHLGATWPKSVHMKDLVAFVEKHLQEADIPFNEENKRKMGLDLLHIIESGCIDIHTWEPKLLTEMPEYPKLRKTSLIAINQYGTAITHRHTLRTMNNAIVHLAKMMTGAHTKAALVDNMIKLAKDGTVQLNNDAGEIKDETAIRSAMEEVVETAMAQFLEGGLFLG